MWISGRKETDFVLNFQMVDSFDCNLEVFHIALPWLSSVVVVDDGCSLLSLALFF